MTTHEGVWPAGTPCWVDLSVSDVTRSQTFYHALFGWEFSAAASEYGGYTNAFVGGLRVAGMSPPMVPDSYLSSSWSVYLATTDSQAAHRAIRAAGGVSVFEPTLVQPHGTMAVYADSTGAVFGTWEGAKHSGYELSGEHGSVAWCEGMVGDFEAAKRFYTEVFGFEYTDMAPSEGSYAMFTVPGGERPAGGIGSVEPGNPPGWSVTFEVDDVDAALLRVQAHGGEVVNQPFDFDYGRLAYVSGPDHEVFGLMTGRSG